MTPRRSPTSATIWRSWANSNAVSNSRGALRNSIHCIRAGTTSALPGTTTTERRTRARIRSVEKIGLPHFYWTHLLDAAAKGQLGHPDAAKALSRILEIKPNFSAHLELRKWNASPDDLITSWTAYERPDGMVDGAGPSAVLPEYSAAMRASAPESSFIPANRLRLRGSFRKAVF